MNAPRPEDQAGTVGFAMFANMRLLRHEASAFANFVAMLPRNGRFLDAMQNFFNDPSGSHAPELYRVLQDLAAKYAKRAAKAEIGDEQDPQSPAAPDLFSKNG